MRTMAWMCSAIVALAAAVGVAATATAAPAASKVRHCSGFEYKPLRTPIRHVTGRHMTCDAARGLAHRYMLATSSTTSRKGVRQGRCFPQHAYGTCRLVYRTHHFSCFHNQAGQGIRGEVRCTRTGHAASFRLPY
jgi:hypothetical protein